MLDLCTYCARAEGLWLVPSFPTCAYAQLLISTVDTAHQSDVYFLRLHINLSLVLTLYLCECSESELSPLTGCHIRMNNGSLFLNFDGAMNLKMNKHRHDNKPQNVVTK